LLSLLALPEYQLSAIRSPGRWSGRHGRRISVRPKDGLECCTVPASEWVIRELSAHVSGVRFHDLRHGFASMLIAARAR
jgi:integrase